MDLAALTETQRRVLALIIRTQGTYRDRMRRSQVICTLDGTDRANYEATDREIDGLVDADLLYTTGPGEPGDGLILSPAVEAALDAAAEAEATS